MEQFGKAVVAIILAAVLAFIAIKASHYIATAVSETSFLPFNPEGHQEGTAQAAE